MATKVPQIFITGLEPTVVELNQLVTDNRALEPKINELGEESTTPRLDNWLDIRKVFTAIVIAALLRLFHQASDWIRIG